MTVAERRRIVEKRLRNGESPAVIARELGVEPHTVTNDRRVLGLTPRQAGRPRTSGAGLRSYPGRGKNFKFGSRWATSELRVQRARKGLTQAQLGERLSAVVRRPITASKICDLERGRSRAPSDLQAAIADALDVSVDELFKPDLREQRPQRSLEVYGQLKSTVKASDVIAVEFGVRGIDTVRADVMRAGGRLLPMGIATLYPEERVALADAVEHLRRDAVESVPTIAQALEISETFAFSLLEERQVPRWPISPGLIQDYWTVASKRKWNGRLQLAQHPEMRSRKGQAAALEVGRHALKLLEFAPAIERKEAVDLLIEHFAGEQALRLADGSRRPGRDLVYRAAVETMNRRLERAVALTRNSALERLLR